MVSNRKRNVLRGAVSNAGTSVVLQVVSLLVIPIYLDLTSSELYGLWLTLGAVLAWVKIGDMGLGLSLTRRAVEALEADDYTLLRSYITGSICVTLLFGAVIFIAGFCAADLLAASLNVREIYQDGFRHTFHILLVVAWVRPSCGILSSIINAKQHIAFLHIKNTIVSLFTIAITLLLLFYEFGISAFAYGLLSEALVTFFIDYSYIKTVDKKFSIFPFRSKSKDVKKLLEFGVPYQALKIANLVATNTDNIIISAYLGAAYVTTYVFTGKLAFLLAVFLVSIAPSVLFPGFSQLFELKKKEKIQKLYLNLSDIALRLGVFSAICFYFINELFVTTWVGADNYGGNYLTIGFVVWILFESFTRGITAVIYASGNLKGLTLVSCFEAAFNILFTLLLLTPFGLMGVVLGTVLSRTISVFYIPIKINNMLDVNHVEYLKRLVKTSLGCIVAMLVSGFILQDWLGSDINSISKILIFGCALLIVNIVSYEGIFLYRLKGVSWPSRLQLLRESYSN